MNVSNVRAEGGPCKGTSRPNFNTGPKRRRPRLGPVFLWGGSNQRAESETHEDSNREQNHEDSDN